MIDGDVKAHEIRGPGGELVIGERIFTGLGRLKKVWVTAIESDRVGLGGGDILRRTLVTVDDEVALGAILPVKVSFIMQPGETEPTGDNMRLSILDVTNSLREFIRLSDDEQEAMMREFEASLIVNHEDAEVDHDEFAGYRSYLSSVVKNKRFEEALQGI